MLNVHEAFMELAKEFQKQGVQIDNIYFNRSPTLHSISEKPKRVLLEAAIQSSKLGTEGGE